MSLRLVGRIGNLSQHWPPLLGIDIGPRQRVTLWADGNAELDAEGQGRVVSVQGGGQLLLHGIHLRGGRAVNGSEGGGCVTRV